MVKKASSRTSKAAARGAKAKMPSRPKTAAPARRKQSAEKYEQVGAPWWKQHLPGR